MPAPESSKARRKRSSASRRAASACFSPEMSATVPMNPLVVPSESRIACVRPETHAVEPSGRR